MLVNQPRLTTVCIYVRMAMMILPYDDRILNQGGE